MYRALLIASHLALLTLGLGTGALAWWGSGQALQQLEHTRLATDVRQEYQRLRADVQTVFGRMAEVVERPGQIEELREPEERRRLVEAVQRVRLAIERETRFGGAAAEDWMELGPLAEIERRALQVFDAFRTAKDLIGKSRPVEAEAVLDRALQEAGGDGFRTLIEAAVEREEAQARDAYAAARQTLDTTALLSKVAASVALVLGIGALLLLLRGLRVPLAELEAAAQAVQAGDLSRRARIGDHGGDFTRVANTFNAMVSRMAVGRANAETAQRGLEAAVVERTAELAAANAALRNADALRRRFLADISHELRTPLTMIRGEAEIALRGAHREEVEYRAALARIVEGAAQTGQLVDDLLFMARAAAGAPRLVLRLVRLDTLVEAVVGEMMAVAEVSQIHLDFTTEAPNARVEADPGRLRQVVISLLDNAIRYSRPGGNVTVSLAPEPGLLVLRVADDGTGIEPEDLPLVFERFWRASHVAAQHQGGSGLGLPLARAVVEAHGGCIGIESRPGLGTTVSVTLPAATPLRAVA